MDHLKHRSVAVEAEVSEQEISALVLEAQAGDQEAFARAFCLLQPRLERYARFLTADEQQALDLLQETMVETWKHLHRYDERARFLTWVSSIMVHRHYDWLRRFRRRTVAIFTEGYDGAVAENDPSPSEATQRGEQAQLMCQCLDQLPAKQRTVVFLRFYAGESLEGIAQILQCSVGTVKSRLFHALQRLAKMPKVQHLRGDAKG